MANTLFVRVGEAAREKLALHIDGIATSCLQGDTLLTAILLNGSTLRSSEFGDGRRAGFCNMGACQDCWITLEDGRRLRACTTFAEKGMRVVTQEPASG